MQNLAGVEREQANKVMEAELVGAGLQSVDEQPSGEVRGTKVGVLDVGPYRIRLRRRWVYWSAEVAAGPGADERPGLPLELARALNDAPGTGEGSYYGGAGKNLGAVVRADGYMQAASPRPRCASPWGTGTSTLRPG